MNFSHFQVVIFIFFIQIISAIHFKQHPLSINDENDTGVLYWFDQLLDHSIPTLTTTWSQRYFVYDQFLDKTNGMVILFICGEWTCDGLGGSQYALTLAEQYKGIVLVLEHRFYGESQPLGYGDDSQTTESYKKYLNVHQALDDLAYFIEMVKAKGLNGVKSTMPWIHMGGSYPGALSAWFRYKYPHLTIGGLASSGVVNAIQDFDKYDFQVQHSTLKSGDFCPQAVVDYTKLAETQFDEQASQVLLLNKFGAEGLTKVEFFNMLADIAAGQVQSGKRVEFCTQLQDLGKTTQEALDIAATYSKSLDPPSYKTESYRKTTYDRTRNSRQWTFQTCTELGYWQTPSKVGQPLRSALLDLNFWKLNCQTIFGDSKTTGNDFWADTDVTNGYLGGADMNVSNLIMTNGGEDPWQHASITEQKNGDIQTLKIDCDDCSHCVDIRTPKETDSTILKDARIQIQKTITAWITQHQEQQ